MYKEVVSGGFVSCGGDGPVSKLGTETFLFWFSACAVRMGYPISGSREPADETAPRSISEIFANGMTLPKGLFPMYAESVDPMLVV